MPQDPPETPSVTVDEDRTTFGVMDPHEVQPGDLLLVTRIPGEPLGELMQRLDGTVFSHSGIGVRTDEDEGHATHLASALAKDLPDDHDIDYGGVRWDRFDTFWPHRDLYCIPMSEPMRQRALGYLAAFAPIAGQEGTFSFVKLVNVAAALRSVELQGLDPELAARLFAATSDVADAWTASPRAPSFYCAELVAHAYGRRFTRAEMNPPASEGLGDDIAEPTWVARLMGLLTDEVAVIDNPRGQAWTRLFDVLFSEDWDFLGHAVTATSRSAAIVGRDVVGDPHVPEPLVLPPRATGPAWSDDPIPHALVTPRMLWAAFGQGTLRRVEQGRQS